MLLLAVWRTVGCVPSEAVSDRFERALASPPTFIVGCPRSGTTLTRLLLDAHPTLAIPPETHFILGLRPTPIRRGRHRGHLGSILAHHRTQLWDVDLDEVRQLVESRAPSSFEATARAAMAAYAALRGKDRWGDKTPGYVERLDTIARMFPDARFVHVIRDGREAAVSMQEQRWGPPSLVTGGIWWRRKVRLGRRHGKALGDRYIELRFEDLVSDPEAALRRTCGFLGLNYTEEMFDYRQSAAVRQPSFGAGLHRHLTKPITPGLRRWDEGLSMSQQRLLEAACGAELVELGYAGRRPGPWWRAAAVVIGRWDALRTTPRYVRDRLHPSSRMF